MYDFKAVLKAAFQDGTERVSVLKSLPSIDPHHLSCVVYARLYEEIVEDDHLLIVDVQAEGEVSKVMFSDIASVRIEQLAGYLVEVEIVVLDGSVSPVLL
jgi:hypothetical protein